MICCDVVVVVCLLQARRSPAANPAEFLSRVKKLAGEPRHGQRRKPRSEGGLVSRRARSPPRDRVQVSELVSSE